MELVLMTAVVLVLLFVDGLIFGVAAAKGIVSIILAIIGIVLAGMIGVAIPFLTTGALLTHVTDIIINQARAFSYYAYGFPIAWIVGLLVGLLAL
jgi:ABC-type sulfate transport system permease subunit